MKNKYTEIVIEELARRIRLNMSMFTDPFLYDNYYSNEENNIEEFKIVKETCILINELLSYIDIKNRILEMAISTTNDKFNKLDIDAKYDTFKMLRNLLIHFSIFESWNDVYINEELLRWNNPKNSYIISYFKKYSGKKTYL